MNHMAAPKVQEERQDGPWPSGATWPGPTPDDFTVKSHTPRNGALGGVALPPSPDSASKPHGEISATKSRSIRLWKQMRTLATLRGMSKFVLRLASLLFQVVGLAHRLPTMLACV